MIRINLLPYHEKAEKANLARQAIIIGACLGIFLFLIALVQLWMMKSVSDLEADIQDKEMKLVGLTKTIGDIEKSKKDKKLLELKLAAINSLEENRLYPVRFLDEISSLVPSRDIWLEEIKQNGNNLQIKGIGKDNVAVSLFMKSLETSKFISSVDIISSKQNEIVGTKLQEFSFTCALRKGK